MIFQSFLLDINESNAYIIASETTRDAILIDIGEFDARIQDFNSQFTIGSVHIDKQVLS